MDWGFDILKYIFDSSGIVLPPKANISPGCKTVEAIRLIKNRINFTKLDEKRWNKIVKNVIDFGNEKDWNRNKINCLDNQLSNQIMECYRIGNAFIAREYFGQEMLFPENKHILKPLSSFYYDDFSSTELNELFMHLLEPTYI
ncbi:MAG: hypothetical protein SVT56_03265 [Chloroflexota bacterium]|nr:hypothetical protein [Chloroflexota bacterium]